MKDNRTVEQMWREMTAPQPVEEALNMQVKRAADQLKKLVDKETNVQKKMKMADEIMQTILGEEYGAGEWGTDKLRKTYAKDTPGQMPNAELAVDGVPTVGGQIAKPDPFKGASAVQKPKGVSLAEGPDDEGDPETIEEEMTRDERIAAIKAAHQRVMQKEKEAEARAKKDAKRGMKSPGATKGMADVKMEAKKLDPVGKADADIDNDGDVDKSDSYLHNRRKAIKKAMKKEEVEAVDEVTYVPGFVGADGKATSKPTAKDYAANKEYQSMKKKLGNKIPGPKPTNEGMMDAVKAKMGKIKKSVSDFRKSDVAAQIRKNKTTKTMESYSDKEVRMAKGIAFDPRHKGGDYTGAAKKMEKIKKGLSDHPKVKDALRRANESVQVEEKTPTGVKIYHRDKKTGKESWSIHFTARDAQRHVDQMKKAGHTETKRSLMYGDKEGKPRIMSK